MKEEKIKDGEHRMKCKNCGTEFNEGIICPECGTRMEENISVSVPVQSNNGNLEKEVTGKKTENEGKTMAILSLICGILSIITMGILFIPEILGIIFACLGKKQGKMRGQAIAGLICSILSLVIIMTVVIAIIISPSGSDGNSRNNTSEDTETSIVDEELVENEEPEITDADEDKEDAVEAEPQEIVDGNENVNTDGYEFDDWWMYNIIPYSSYESGGEDLHLYMNLVWNEDGSIDLYGFAYSYDEPIEEYETMVHLTPDSENESYYVSDYRNFFVGILDSYIAIASDGDEMGHAFQGDFSLVSDGSVVFTGDYVEVLYGEIPNFFRDTANVYSTFRCNLYYTSYYESLGRGYHFLHYVDETGTQITFIMDAKPDDPKFFYNDLVTVTGVYLDQNQYELRADVAIENISIELFNN